MIYIVLIEPEKAVNVGSVARVMSNFGFSKLILVNPQCEHLGDEAKKVAKRAFEILERAEVIDSWDKLKMDLLIGTTALITRDYNIKRVPIAPWELASKLSSVKGGIGIVFGRESIGLKNQELMLCDVLVKIPTAKYAAMNLSHAVAVILYELRKETLWKKLREKMRLARAEELKRISMLFEQVLERLPFEREGRKITQRITWKRLFGKAMLSRREAMAVMGFFRKLLKNLR